MTAERTKRPSPLFAVNRKPPIVSGVQKSFNFHSGYSYQNDYKLRYALQGTRYWGSYITDIIKLYAEVDSGKVKEYLREHPDVVRKNINDFVEEISILGEDPVLVALGSYTYDILNSYLGKKYRIAKIKPLFRAALEGLR